MISKLINVSTGPVGITREVQKALEEASLSHRSNAFRKLYDQTTAFLSHTFHVRDTYLFTGSGTVANEVMLQEIKCRGGIGLILSNGEFGNRLISQAHRIGLDFLQYKVEPGNAFNMDNVKNILINHPVKWLLYCHCETSTGMITDLKQLTDLAITNNCLCFVDCMSTVGTSPLDLSGVAMATASSGKGLASIPGLAIVFSNIEPVFKLACPLYLDLYHYKTTSGIPFTISSNLLKALYISTRQKLQEEQYELIIGYRKRFFNSLKNASVVPFSNENTSVFTIMPRGSTTQQFVTKMMKHHLLLSYESDYLKEKRWCQLATFGYYTEKQLKQVSKNLHQLTNDKFILSQY